MVVSRKIFLENYLSNLMVNGVHIHNNSGWSSTEEIFRSKFLLMYLNSVSTLKLHLYKTELNQGLRNIKLLRVG